MSDVSSLEIAESSGPLAHLYSMCITRHTAYLYNVGNTTADMQELGQTWLKRKCSQGHFVVDKHGR
jgi:hypothetical protein